MNWWSPVYGTDEETNIDFAHLYKPVSAEIYKYVCYDYFLILFSTFILRKCLD